jgi:N-acetylneuraminic acid mutarotase
MRVCKIVIIAGLLVISTLYAADFQPFGGWNVGISGGRVFNDVWAFDTEDETWRQIEPSGSAPAARIDPAAIFNATGNEMLIFGGRDDAYNYFNDIWSLSLTPGSEAWTQLNPSGTPPSPRLGAKAVVDAVNNRMIIFGGTTSYSGFDETWTLDLSTYTWSLLNPSGSRPPARQAHCAIYDPIGHRMIIYAGSNWGVPIMNDVWSLDLTYGSEAWQQLFPGGQQPEPRTQHFGIYDQYNNDMVMGFGYNYSAYFTYYDDVWILELTSMTWQRIIPQTTTVAPRRASCAAYDPNEHRVIIFGGNQDNFAYFADTYVLTLDMVGVSDSPKAYIQDNEYITFPQNPSKLPSQINLHVPSAAYVSLKVYDNTGRIINTLIQGQKSSGDFHVNWEGLDARGRKVAAGTYYFVLTLDGEAIQEKSIILD